MMALGAVSAGPAGRIGCILPMLTRGILRTSSQGTLSGNLLVTTVAQMATGTDSTHPS